MAAARPRKNAAKKTTPARRKPGQVAVKGQSTQAVAPAMKAAQKPSDRFQNVLVGTPIWDALVAQRGNPLRESA